MDTNGTMTVTVYILKERTEKEYYAACCASLNIVGCGCSIEEAKSDFECVLNDHIKFWLENKCFLANLKRLGWDVVQTGEKSYHATCSKENEQRILSFMTDDYNGEEVGSDVIGSYTTDIPQAV